MKYLLDTNAIIHLFNGYPILTANVKKRPPSELAISGFTEAEIAFGVENSDPEMREHNRTARTFGMVPFQRIYHDESISTAYGVIKAHLKSKGSYHPANEIDIFIAATAVAKSLTVVTQNQSDFISIPNLKLEDWSK